MINGFSGSNRLIKAGCGCGRLPENPANHLICPFGSIGSQMASRLVDFQEEIF
jgi:hypothetical protein